MEPRKADGENQARDSVSANWAHSSKHFCISWNKGRILPDFGAKSFNYDNYNTETYGYDHPLCTGYNAKVFDHK